MRKKTIFVSLILIAIACVVGRIIYVKTYIMLPPIESMYLLVDGKKIRTSPVNPNANLSALILNNYKSRISYYDKARSILEIENFVSAICVCEEVNMINATLVFKVNSKIVYRQQYKDVDNTNVTLGECKGGVDTYLAEFEKQYFECNIEDAINTYFIGRDSDGNNYEVFLESLSIPYLK